MPDLRVGGVGNLDEADFQLGLVQDCLSNCVHFARWITQRASGGMVFYFLYWVNDAGPMCACTETLSDGRYIRGLFKRKYCEDYFESA